jgi:hypothetical protein
MYLEMAPGTVSTGDTIVVRAYLDTDAAASNALDGTINLSGSSSTVQIREINLAESILTLWPHAPALSADGKSISFTGGLPGGFTGVRLLLFSIVVAAKAPGTIIFTPSHSTLYLHDGKGTGVPVIGRAFTLAIVAAQSGVAPRDEWQSAVSGDTTPPASFTIEYGQDPSVHDGKKYIFFQTTDTGSGIDYYEVREGNSPPVRSGSTYVLQDQVHPAMLTVYAYDRAHNVRTSVYNEKGTNNFTTSLLLLLVGILLIIGIVWRLWRNRNHT